MLSLTREHTYEDNLGDTHRYRISVPGGWLYGYRGSPSYDTTFVPGHHLTFTGELEPLPRMVHEEVNKELEDKEKFYMSLIDSNDNLEAEVTTLKQKITLLKADLEKARKPSVLEKLLG